MNTKEETPELYFKRDSKSFLQIWEMWTETEYLHKLILKSNDNPIFRLELILRL